MSDVVVVGSINVDLVVRVARHPAPGETVLGEAVRTLPGGKGANQAVAAARFGAATAMIGAVGDDEHAEVALRGLVAARVDRSRIEHLSQATGLAIVQVDEAGENSIVVVPGANAWVSPVLVRRYHDAIAAARVVVMQGEIPRAAIEAVAPRVTGRLLLNLAPVIELDAEVVRIADPLVVNAHEAVGALELLGAGAPGETPTPADAARRLVDAGVRSAIVTAGSDGAYAASRDASDRPTVEHLPAPPVRPIDTTGAGDAFAGALAAALARGDSLRDAAALATRAASASVGESGAQPTDGVPGGSPDDAQS